MSCEEEDTCVMHETNECTDVSEVSQAGGPGNANGRDAAAEGEGKEVGGVDGGDYSP